MFGFKKSAAHRNNHTLISRDTKVIGDIHFIGELQIEGQVVGNVIAADANEASLVIHEKGRIEGEVRSPNAIINGQVLGDVYSTSHIELASKAIIQGNVYYNIIEMVKGSQVNGNLVFSEDKSEDTHQANTSLDTTKKTNDVTA